MSDQREVSAYRKWELEHSARVHAILNDPECILALETILSKGHRRDAVHAAYSQMRFRPSTIQKLQAASDPFPRRCDTKLSVENGECEACGAYEGEACLKPKRP